MPSPSLAAPGLRPASKASVEFWRDPALPFFEGRRAVASVSCYAPHTHPTWSIGVVDHGSSVFSLPQGQTRIEAGDVVLIAAEEVHSCNPVAREEWSYRMFHLDCTWLGALLTETGLDPAVLRTSQVLPLRINQAQRAVGLLDDISCAVAGNDDALHQETVLVAALCELLNPLQAAPIPQDMIGDAHELRDVHDYLRQHCCDKISLDTLALIAGTGRYQLIRRFRRQFGITPHAMQLDMRINLARDLLRRGLSLVEVAGYTGFADQSHFHRAFKSRVAVTPAQYRVAS